MTEKTARFNDRARTALTAAEGVARRLKCSRVTAEHLLVALVTDDEDVSGDVLARLGATPGAVLFALNIQAASCDEDVSGESELAEETRKVIEFAVDEALRHGHSYISTEHLLLGILREGKCTAATLLSERFPVNLERARIATKRAFKAAPNPVPEDARVTAERALFTDAYQLTMLQAYMEHGLTGRATFELYARSLPTNRNYLIACGLDDALGYLEGLRFEAPALATLERSERFPLHFLDWLADLRFTGDVYAMAEGTVAFGGEPLLTVEAPLPEAQIAETYLLNQIHFQTLIASKGSRIVDAARDRSVVDFGTRRAHGTDAALKAARALFIAGMAATSNVLAADRYGIPAVGTMAHSYVLAHDDESDAFRSFIATHPDTSLLVDTYDTAEGVRRVTRIAAEMGADFRVAAVRLDSEPLAELAKETRGILDAAGLQRVQIIASGGLDEARIDELIAAAAPIEAFGVGTRAATSADQPTFDAVYKLTAYDGRGRMKLSSGKETLPGRKQVFRRYDSDGLACGDVIAKAGEAGSGEPLVQQVMRAGRRLEAGTRTIMHARARAAEQRMRLPAEIRALTPGGAYPVTISGALEAEAASLRADLLRD